MIYLIGSMRNPYVLTVAKRLRTEGYEVFDDWHSSGPDSDDHWKAYEKLRGRTYAEALQGAFAKATFGLDRKHLELADTVVLVAPCGRSGHLELGWSLGQGKKGYVLLDDSDRWDIMLQFATGVFANVDELVGRLDLDRREDS